MNRHLFEYLTQEEWKTLYAFAFIEGTEEYANFYPLSRYADPKADPETWEEGMFRALKWLVQEHGADFEFLKHAEDGLPDEPICPENANYRLLLGLGVGANPLAALRTAKRWLRQHAPDVNTEPFDPLIADIERQVAMVDIEGEVRDEVMRFRGQALSSLGIKMRTKEEVN